MSDSALVLTDPEVIKFYQMIARRGALRLEVIGMSRSRGPSAYSTIKKVYDLKGSKITVLSQLNALIETERTRLSNKGLLS